MVWPRRRSSTVTGLFSVLNPSAGRKSCPLCPEEKFKACYSHKLRRHLQNLHWKVYVEFEGRPTQPRLVPLTCSQPLNTTLQQV